MIDLWYIMLTYNKCLKWTPGVSLHPQNVSHFFSSNPAHFQNKLNFSYTPYKKIERWSWRLSLNTVLFQVFNCKFAEHLCDSNNADYEIITITSDPGVISQWNVFNKSIIYHFGIVFVGYSVRFKHDYICKLIIRSFFSRHLIGY